MPFCIMAKQILTKLSQKNAELQKLVTINEPTEQQRKDIQQLMPLCNIYTKLL